MDQEAIHELIHRRPFEPFEVRMSNGDAYLVKHPEFAMLVKNRLVIGDPETGRLGICSLPHVANVQMSELTQ